MSAIGLYATALTAGLLVVGAVWVLHLRLKNAGVIDVAWGVNLALMALLYASLADGWAARRWLVAAMVGLTGLRLSWHIARRTFGHPEDGRYAGIRAAFRTNVPLKFLRFFVFQGVIASLLSLPFLVASRNTTPAFHPLEIAALVLFAIGMAGEALADAQLEAFKADPATRGTACRRGLWRYSRHPNYFFEWLLWVSYWLFACASPWGWATLFAPALMLWVLLRVTGVAITEAHCLQTRGDDYRRYQQTTSAFVPWFPRG